MAKWGEIKCPRCEENDALWEGMERALEESDAREARSRRWREELERWLEESETREATLNDRITMLEEHLCLTEEKLSKCEALLAKALTTLEKLSTAQCFGNGEILGYDLSENPMGREVLARMKYARTTLAELKGQGDD